MIASLLLFRGIERADDSGEFLQIGQHQPDRMDVVVPRQNALPDRAHVRRSLLGLVERFHVEHAADPRLFNSAPPSSARFDVASASSFSSTR